MASEHECPLPSPYDPNSVARETPPTATPPRVRQTDSPYALRKELGLAALQKDAGAGCFDR